MLLAMLLFFGGIVMLAVGSDQIKNGEKRGNFLFWPGGILIGVFFGGATHLAGVASVENIILIAAISCGLSLGGVLLLTHAVDKD